MWAQILSRVPNSKLLLKSWNDNDKERNEYLLMIAKSQGIEKSRILFQPRAETYEAHLNLYNEMDIALDTFPYNGTTTTFEALLMGTPVVALEGSAHRSRVGLSILNNIELSSLCAKTTETYIDTAQYLANNLDLLEQLNSGLRQKLLNSALCNKKGFIQNFEEALVSLIKH